MHLSRYDALAFYYGETEPPKPNEVHIGKTAIVMPLERIILVRRESEYCAIKFTKFWNGRTNEDYFAEYESYCKIDNTKEFANNNIQVKKGKLSFPKPRGIGRLAFSFGNKEIKCGTITLFWSGLGAVHFYRQGQEQGDYGIELAPTKWTDISQINITESRLKWYRFDNNRKRVNIPVDKLWQDKADKK